MFNCYAFILSSLFRFVNLLSCRLLIFSLEITKIEENKEKRYSIMSEVKCPLPHNHGVDEEKILRHLPSAKTVEDVSLVLRQLSDPTRLKIFWILCHMEECVINIAAIMNMSSPAVSHHLRLLKTCGLINSRRDGKEMYYEAADTEMVNELHRAIDSIAKITLPE